MKKILCIILLALLCFFSTGCLLVKYIRNRDQFNRVASGDFVYSTISSDEGHCRIIGLSEEGSKKEVLVFPAILDGYIVDGLGAQFWLKDSGEIVITNAKKLYFPTNYYVSHSWLDFQTNYDKEEISAYIAGRRSFNDAHRIYEHLYGDCEKIFTSGKFYDLYNTKYHLELANVVYYVDEEIFFVDDCDGKIVNVIPPIPYKEGYEFMGWYKDKDCTIKWDFRNDIIDKKEYDEEGNYIYKETKIYSKWKEIKKGGGR